MKNIHRQLLEHLRAGQALVLATVVKTSGSTPQKPGSSALFGEKGLIAGTVGGGQLEGDVAKIAHAALISKNSGLYYFNQQLDSVTDTIVGEDTSGLVTGLLGPNSNAHGPNEFLHIETGKRVTVTDKPGWISVLAPVRNSLGDVVGLVEALPEVGGYKVHADKLQRLGVPIYTGHTVVSANGKDKVESVTIARLDQNWNAMPDTHKTFEVDTVLIAVGLAEVNEFYLKAKQWGMDVYCAGDAQEIAEASAAMFTGKIEGHKIAQALNIEVEQMPGEWDTKATILKSKPGPATCRKPPAREEGVFPIFHCYQEVPCNPCASVCPVDAI